MVDTEYLKSHYPFFLILLGTIIFWLSIRLNREVRTTIQVPIKYDVPHGKLLAEDTPRNIEAIVEGKVYHLWSALDNNGIFVQLSESENQLVNSEILTSKVMGVLSDHVSLQGLPVSSLDVRLYEAQTKKVPIVSHHLTINPAPYYHIVSDVTLSPDSVTISGPKTWLDKYNQWEIRPKEINNVSRDYVDLQLSLESYKGPENIYLSQGKVNASFQVDQLKEIKMNCPIENQNDVVMIPDEVEVNVSYASRLIHEVDCTILEFQFHTLDSTNTLFALNIESKEELATVISNNVDTIKIYKNID